MRNRVVLIMLSVLVLLTVGGTGYFFGQAGKGKEVTSKTVVASDAKKFLAEAPMEVNSVRKTKKQKEVGTNTVVAFRADLNVVREQLKVKLEEEKQKQQ